MSIEAICRKCRRRFTAASGRIVRCQSCQRTADSDPGFVVDSSVDFASDSFDNGSSCDSGGGDSGGGGGD